jgi:hypothetical protein
MLPIEEFYVPVYGFICDRDGNCYDYVKYGIGCNWSYWIIPNSQYFNEKVYDWWRQPSKINPEKTRLEVFND